MKKIIFFLTILSITIILFALTFIKYNNLDYNKKISDKDDFYLLVGTKNVLEMVLENEKKNWGKNANNKVNNNYYEYININIDILKTKLNEREYDKYYQKSSQYIKVLEELSYLKEYVGEDYDIFKDKYQKLIKEVNKKELELKEVVE